MKKTPNLQELAGKDGRFNVEAYVFVSQSLRHAAKSLGKTTAPRAQRHLTAEQLVEGALDLAVEQFGLLAEPVLRSWGIRTSEDLGLVTFALIEHGVFTKQPSDRIEDFYVGPDFGPAIRERVRIRISQRKA
jgi:uncharacterized repeat protein (TIGR04138 family)